MKMQPGNSTIRDHDRRHSLLEFLLAMFVLFRSSILVVIKPTQGLLDSALHSFFVLLVELRGELVITHRVAHRKCI